MQTATSNTLLRDCGRRRLSILLSALSLVVVKANPADLTLDLTEQRPATDLLPMVGFVRAGAGDAAPVVKPMKLPLEVTIQDISPLTPWLRVDEVEVQLLVRNTGKEPVAIPSSKHYSDTMKSGNEDRRVMNLTLTFTVDAANGVPASNVAVSKGLIREFMAASVGSSSVPGSMLVIGAGQSVLIQVRERLWSTLEWDNLGPGPFLTTVRAVLSEQFVYDDRLYEKNYTEDAISVNAVHLTVSSRP